MGSIKVSIIRPADWPEKETIPGDYPVTGGTLTITDRFTTVFTREEAK